FLGARGRHAVELGLAHGVNQTVADGVLAARLADGAVGQVVGTATAPFFVGDRAFGVEVGAGGIDQAKLSGTGQVGPDDLADVLALGVARKIGNGDGVLRGTDARYVDPELGVGWLCRHQTDCQHQHSQDPDAPARGYGAFSWSDYCHIYYLLLIVHSVVAFDGGRILARGRFREG